jgi:hypothetical protein
MTRLAVNLTAARPTAIPDYAPCGAFPITRLTGHSQLRALRGIPNYAPYGAITGALPAA